jgi:uncharacterized MnhB-related membrane protein
MVMGAPDTAVGTTGGGMGTCVTPGIVLFLISSSSFAT